MKITFTIFVLVGLVQALIAGATVFPGKDWEVATPESQGVDPQRLQAAMEHLESLVGSDGTMQSMVVRHGRVIWQGDHTDSWHNVYSCTKSFLSMTAGLLVDDGTIRLNEPLCNHVPELKALYPGTTAEHCLSLTAGYAATVGDHPFNPAKPRFVDGEAFHYGGDALNMLAYALTRASGEPLDEVFMRRIGDPIGLDRRWIWGDFGYVDGLRIHNGSGSHFKGIHTTAENLARVGLLLLNNGRWKDQQLLSPEWIQTASRPHADANLPMHNPDGWYSVIRGAYGLGFWVNGIRPDGKRLWPDAPEGTFAIQGNLNNICLIVPEWDLLLVRLGMDNRIDNDRYTEVFATLSEALENKD